MSSEPVPFSPTPTAVNSAAPSAATSPAPSLLKKKEAASRPASPTTDVEMGAEPQKTDRAPIFVVVLCLFQSFAGLLFGWESGVISGLVNMQDFQMRFGAPDPTTTTGYSIPTTRQSLITSFMGLGAFFGSMIAGKVAARLGFKIAGAISLVIFLVGVAVETSAQKQWGQVVAGRLISGYGVGALSMIAPAYQAQVSPRQLRGVITSTYQLAATFGIFFANVVNYSMRSHSGAVSWRIPLAIQLPIGVLVLVGTLLGPELPRFYIERGNVEAATKSLSKIRGLPVGDRELEEEIEAMLLAKERDDALGEGSYAECFTMGESRSLLRTMIGMGVQMGQQWSGINFFFSYGVKFFQSAGIADSYLIQMILSSVNVISTFPGLWAVDHLGRRTTLLIGSGIMFTGQVVAGALGTAKPDDPTAGKVLITFSCIFIFGFASSWGPLGWVVAAEQFSPRLASYSTSLGTGSNWINNFILAMITPYITDAGYGNLQSKITFIWAAAILLFAVFVFFVVPETKGLSLVQVDELYVSGVPAWKSANWVPFGGVSTRNKEARDETASEKALKLGGEKSHLENTARKRNLE